LILIEEKTDTLIVPLKEGKLDAALLAVPIKVSTNLLTNYPRESTRNGTYNIQVKQDALLGHYSL